MTFDMTSFALRGTVVALMMAPVAALALDFPTRTGAGSAGCTQLELGIGLKGAECGVMPISEQVRIKMDRED